MNIKKERHEIKRVRNVLDKFIVKECGRKQYRIFLDMSDIFIFVISNLNNFSVSKFSNGG